MTPPRPEPAEDEPDVPLRERMARLHDDLARHRDLLDVVAPGAPRAHAPVTVSEAIELADAIASAKAKENVRPPDRPARRAIDEPPRPLPP